MALPSAPRAVERTPQLASAAKTAAKGVSGASVSTAAKRVPPKTAAAKLPAPAAKAPAKKPVGPEFNFPRSELSAIRALIHAGDGVNSEYQFLIWLQEVQLSYQRFAILIRSWDVYVAVKDRLVNCHLIFASSANGVEEMVARMKSLRLVLYVSNTGNNLHLLRYNHLIHAFIGHGDSEKSASCHKFFRAYDEIWVAGQAHIDRFSNAQFDTRHINFVRVGRGSLRSQLAAASPDALTQPVFGEESEADDSCGEPVSRRYLYLPTWEGAFDDSSYSSLEHTLKMLEQLSEGGPYKGAVKFHPMTGKRIPVFADFERRLHARFDQEDIQIIPRAESHVDAYAHVDFLVADVSSVITDFLVTLKPIFVYWPGFKNLRLSESRISIKDYCYAFSTIDELERSVRRVISEGIDDLRDARRSALAYYVDLPATERGAFQRRIFEACRPDSDPFALPESNTMEIS